MYPLPDSSSIPTVEDSHTGGFASAALPADELAWLNEHFRQDLPANDFAAEMEYLSWVERCRQEETESDGFTPLAA